MHTGLSTHLGLLPHHGVVFGFDGHRKPQLNGGCPGDVGLNVQHIGALHEAGRGGRENSICMSLIQSCGYTHTLTTYVGTQNKI